MVEFYIEQQIIYFPFNLAIDVSAAVIEVFHPTIRLIVTINSFKSKQKQELMGKAGEEGTTCMTIDIMLLPFLPRK